MKRLLTASVALVLANASIAPVFAESLPQQTNPATKQQLTNPATKQQLIVPEGQVMTDAELAKVEGEWFWVVPVAKFVAGNAIRGAAIGTVNNCFQGRCRLPWQK
jgi:hypothetical protein